MNLHRFLPAARVAATLAFVLTAGHVSAKRPNILFIMSDDHAAHAIGAYGGRLASLNPTPTIDRLAREGVRLDNVYCTNSICSPSRACILTGQYPHTNGAYDLSGKVLPENQHLAHAMKRAGYQTAMIGKWHLKAEPAAFDYYCVLPGQGKYHGPSFRVRGEQPWPKSTISFPEKHSSDAITDQTLNWLSEEWDSTKPFFLMHHYKAPHDYFENDERYQDYLADTEIPKPQGLFEPYAGKFGSIATRGADDELVRYLGTSIGNRNVRRSYSKDLPERFPEEFPDDFDPAGMSDTEITTLAYNAYLRKYLRCVKGIDDNLARLFDHLESIGQINNTVILYTGDQGFMLGEHDYQDKRWMYEPSQRMPLLIRYPKSISAGTVSDAIIENVDFAPTMLDFAGVDTPEIMQGRSFKSILETGEEPDDWKEAAYYRYWMHLAHHFNPACVGIRTKRHKLIFYYGCDYEGDNQTPPGWELYDMQRDPLETTNQYDNPEYAMVVQRLKQQLAELRREVGDDGTDFPKAEAVIEEFWDDDAEDRRRAIQISHDYLRSVQQD